MNVTETSYLNLELQSQAEAKPERTLLKPYMVIITHDLQICLCIYNISFFFFLF
jgi:hypothetical protein